MHTNKPEPILCALALALLPLGCIDDGRDAYDLSEDDRVVGGQDTQIDTVPWQISMQGAGGGHFCGGSVIDAGWILTAAHCVEGTSADAIRVVAGITRLSQPDSEGQVRKVTQIISHPEYVSVERGADVALLKLDSDLDLSGPRVSKIALATAANEADFAPGKDALVSGWGTLSSGGQSPDTLQSVTVPIVSLADADAAYSDVMLTPDQLGAGIIGQGGVDACQGDSGGPLVVGGGSMLAGVVSWGYGCADPKYPGMYARVASFTSWVQDTMAGGGGGGGGGNPPPQPPQPPPPGGGGDDASCSGHCGDMAPSGCWCDAECTANGDCCADFDATCGGGGNPPPPPPGGGGDDASCVNHCDDMAPSGCWCDAECTANGDCCADYDATCGGGNPPPPPPGGGGDATCVGHCDAQTASGCWCDAECTANGDCCPDYQNACV